MASLFSAIREDKGGEAVKITSRKVGDVVVIEIEGVYSRDARPEPPLAGIVDAELASGEKKYVIDLEKVELASDVAIGEILAAFKRIYDWGGQLKLARPSPGTLRLLKMTMLYKVLDIGDSLESALGSFSENP